MAVKKITRDLLKRIRKEWPLAHACVEQRRCSHQTLRMKLEEKEFTISFSLTPTSNEICINQVVRDVRRKLNQVY